MVRQEGGQWWAGWEAVGSLSFFGGRFPGVTDVGSAYLGTVFTAGKVLGTVLGAGDSGVKEEVSAGQW